MTVEQCFEVGVVLRPHGLQGEVTISLDVDFPEEYSEMESVFLLQNGNLVPFFIDSLKLKNKEAFVKFEDIDSKEQALSIKGLPLYLPLDLLPELEPDQFYFHEIIDFTIEDEKEGVLGVVNEVYEAGHQDLIGMMYKGKEVLIPINDHIIQKVDRANKKLHVLMPEGLLELYLNNMS